MLMILDNLPKKKQVAPARLTTGSQQSTIRM